LLIILQDLEAALLTDGTEDNGNSLLQELIARLLSGCFGNNSISTFNYQMFLRRLFREKCKVSVLLQKLKILFKIYMINIYLGVQFPEPLQYRY